MALPDPTSPLQRVRLDLPRLRRLGYVAHADQGEADRLLLSTLDNAREMRRLGALPPASRSMELFRLYRAHLEAAGVRTSKVHAIRAHLRPHSTEAIAARLWSLSWLERIAVALTRLDTFSTAEAVYILQRPRPVLEDALERAFLHIDPQGFSGDGGLARAIDPT